MQFSHDLRWYFEMFLLMFYCTPKGTLGGVPAKTLSKEVKTLEKTLEKQNTNNVSRLFGRGGVPAKTLWKLFVFLFWKNAATFAKGCGIHGGMVFFMQYHFTSAVCKFIFPSLFIENILHKLIPVWNAHAQKNYCICWGKTPVEM